ncbi:MAG TPA: DUF302 domain-containing protein [Parasulfuritortus sp.]
MNSLKRFAVILLLLQAVALPAKAEGLMMVRSQLPFEDALSALEIAIQDQGYAVTRLQQVNENLAKRAYKSDMYRVVFFGKLSEIRPLAASHPDLIPFLPLHITLFAEGKDTIVLCAPPTDLEEWYPDPKLKPIFEHWEHDMRLILNRMQQQKSL